MKNTTAMADYELRHIEALRKNLAGCTVLLKKDGSFPLEKPCTLAAYKMPNVAHALAKAGANVHVLMTKNATEFITPLVFETLTNNR